MPGLRFEGAGSLAGAQFYSEANIYEARPGTICLPPCPDPNPCGDSDWQVSKLGLVTDWDTNGAGYTKSVGDLPLNDAKLSVNEPAKVFDPHAAYAYTADTASTALAAKIKAEAGARASYCK
ncbi:MAG: hypothetical protein IPI67_31750 [Myxococcales bacterium]|nr:hypothetical protein [Myxococcales bacterium]